MTTARRTQQQRRDQAETALLNAAAELAVEHGVRSLTLARVGERAGYSRGIVTHHFGSKQALLERRTRRGRSRDRRATPRDRAAAAARPAGRQYRTAASHRHRALASRAERSPDLTPGHCARRTESTGSHPHGASSNP